jgi:hypothetical protein
VSGIWIWSKKRSKRVANERSKHSKTARPSQDEFAGWRGEQAERSS